MEKQLIAIAERLGARGTIHYQDEPLVSPTPSSVPRAHSRERSSWPSPIRCSAPESTIDESRDGVIWVNRIDDPRMFGVVKLDGEGFITDFVEKPQEFISDLAIIGIYYFKDGEYLRKELQFLLDTIREKGDVRAYQRAPEHETQRHAFRPG